MGRIVRENGFTYELDEQGNRYTVNLGTDVVSEMEAYLPIVTKVSLNITSWMTEIYIGLLKKLRNYIAPGEELQRILQKEAEMVPRKFGNGLLDAFKRSFYVGWQGSVVMYQITRCLVLRIKMAVTKKDKKS